jgi:hypothetical protein
MSYFTNLSVCYWPPTRYILCLLGTYSAYSGATWCYSVPTGATWYLLSSRPWYSGGTGATEDLLDCYWDHSVATECHQYLPAYRVPIDYYSVAESMY